MKYIGAIGLAALLTLGTTEATTVIDRQGKAPERGIEQIIYDNYDMGIITKIKAYKETDEEKRKELFLEAKKYFKTSFNNKRRQHESLFQDAHILSFLFPKNPQEYIDSINKIMDKVPKNRPDIVSHGYSMNGEILLRSGSIDEAMMYYTLAIRKFDSAEHRMNRLISLMYKIDAKEKILGIHVQTALEDAKEYIRLKPKDLLVLNEYILLHLLMLFVHGYPKFFL